MSFILVFGCFLFYIRMCLKINKSFIKMLHFCLLKVSWFYFYKTSHLGHSFRLNFCITSSNSGKTFEDNGFHSEFDKFKNQVGFRLAAFMKLAGTVFTNKPEKPYSLTKTVIIKNIFWITSFITYFKISSF